MPARKKSLTKKKTATTKSVKTPPVASATPEHPQAVAPSTNEPIAPATKAVDKPTTTQTSQADKQPIDPPHKPEPKPTSATLAKPGPTTPRTPTQPSADKTPSPPPAPLVVTTYNQERVKRSMVLMGLAIVVGVGVLAWVFRDAWMIWNRSQANSAEVHQLEVSTEEVNQAKLSAITQASQASTPAEASAAPNLKPVYLDPSWAKKSTAELFTELKASQQQLKDQQIPDNQAIQHYLDLATKYQAQDDAKARQQLLNGLQLSLELQVLHDYYKK